MLHVILEIGGDALQAADRDRRFLDAAAAARGLAWSVAGAAENSRKHIRFPVDHIGVAVTAFGDQADVFRHGRMRGASPLAVDHFVKVIRCRNISRFHSYLVRAGVTVDAAFDVCSRTLMNGVLVVSQAYHGLNESVPVNMIGAAVKSHFYLIVIRYRCGTQAFKCHAGSCGSAIYA